MQSYSEELTPVSAVGGMTDGAGTHSGKVCRGQMREVLSARECALSSACSAKLLSILCGEYPEQMCLQMAMPCWGVGRQMGWCWP